jgi:hypothetical protein
MNLLKDFYEINGGYFPQAGVFAVKISVGAPLLKWRIAYHFPLYEVDRKYYKGNAIHKSIERTFFVLVCAAKSRSFYENV